MPQYVVTIPKWVQRSFEDQIPPAVDNELFRYIRAALPALKTSMEEGAIDFPKASTAVHAVIDEMKKGVRALTGSARQAAEQHVYLVEEVARLNPGLRVLSRDYGEDALEESQALEIIIMATVLKPLVARGSKSETKAEIIVHLAIPRLSGGAAVEPGGRRS